MTIWRKTLLSALTSVLLGCASTTVDPYITALQDADGFTLQLASSSTLRTDDIAIIRETLIGMGLQEDAGTSVLSIEIAQQNPRRYSVSYQSGARLNVGYSIDTIVTIRAENGTYGSYRIEAHQNPSGFRRLNVEHLFNGAVDDTHDKVVQRFAERMQDLMPHRSVVPAILDGDERTWRVLYFHTASDERRWAIAEELRDSGEVLPTRLLRTVLWDTRGTMDEAAQLRRVPIWLQRGDCDILHAVFVGFLYGIHHSGDPDVVNAIRSITETVAADSRMTADTKARMIELRERIARQERGEPPEPSQPFSCD